MLSEGENLNKRGDVDWIGFIQDREQWRAVVSVVTKIQLFI
jgi:hypothetical protein